MQIQQRTTSWLTITAMAMGIFATMTSHSFAQMPVPGPEYDMLKKDVGTWKATMTMFISPDGTPLPEPMVSEGTETNYMLGGLWLIGDFKGKIGPMDFHGHSVIGYDARSKKYSGSWVDSMTPSPSHMVGTYDKQKKAMIWEMTTVGPDGNTMKGKSVQEFKDDGNTRVFTMYNAAPGSDKMNKSMEIVYKKVQKKMAVER